MICAPSARDIMQRKLRRNKRGHKAGVWRIFWSRRRVHRVRMACKALAAAGHTPFIFDNLVTGGAMR